jgi:hypothetical protein
MEVCSIGDSVFTMCYHFTGTVNSLYNPNGDKDGYIYVPRKLINKYLSDSNWSTQMASDRFRILEEYTVDGTLTGALDYIKI